MPSNEKQPTNREMIARANGALERIVFAIGVDEVRPLLDYDNPIDGIEDEPSGEWWEKLQEVLVFLESCPLTSSALARLQATVNFVENAPLQGGEGEPPPQPLNTLPKNDLEKEAANRAPEVPLLVWRRWVWGMFPEAIPDDIQRSPSDQELLEGFITLLANCGFDLADRAQRDRASSVVSTISHRAFERKRLITLHAKVTQSDITPLRNLNEALRELADTVDDLPPRARSILGALNSPVSQRTPPGGTLIFGGEEDDEATDPLHAIIELYQHTVDAIDRAVEPEGGRPGADASRWFAQACAACLKEHAPTDLSKKQKSGAVRILLKLLGDPRSRKTIANWLDGDFDFEGSPAKALHDEFAKAERTVRANNIDHRMAWQRDEKEAKARGVRKRTREMDAFLTKTPEGSGGFS